ncbi:MAG: HNH endonuclease [Sandaracinaceae bacterium]
METLILTHSYLPHRVVGWQKAISMSYTGKVEVLETYDEVIRSVSLAVPMPAVVRLVRAVRRHEPRLRFSRANVLARDGFACQYCGETLPSRDLTLDHVVPRARGGGTTWENTVTACRPCNGRKGNRTPEEARMTLRRTPTRPQALTFQLRRMRRAQPMPGPWRAWVWWDKPGSA